MGWAERSSSCSSFQTRSLFAASLGCSGRVREEPFSNSQVNCPANCPKNCPAVCPANCPKNCWTNSGASCWGTCHASLPISALISTLLPISAFLAHLPISYLPIFAHSSIHCSPGLFEPPSGAPGTAPPRLVCCWTCQGPGLSLSWGAAPRARCNPHPLTQLSHRLRLSLLFLPLCSGAKTTPTSPTRWG